MTDDDRLFLKMLTELLERVAALEQRLERIEKQFRIAEAREERRESYEAEQRERA